MAINFPPPIQLYLPLTGGTLTGGLAGTTLTLGGATIGANALAVTGAAVFTSTVTAGAFSAPSAYFGGSYVQLGPNPAVYMGATNGGNDLIISRRAAANMLIGGADAASPVAQTLSVQGVIAGTTNTAGANWTFAGSQGTGTGAGGSLIFQTAAASGSGSTQNALATALTIDSTKLATFAGAIAATVGTFSGNVAAGGASQFYWAARSTLGSPSDGKIQLGNYNTNGFTALETFSGAGTVIGWYQGTGSPEAVVTARIGSFYSRYDGGAATSFYVKESGTGNTGWVAK